MEKTISRKEIMTYTPKNETLYQLALKFYPENVIEGIYRINDKNNLYGKDLYLLEKFMDYPINNKELIIN